MRRSIFEAAALCVVAFLMIVAGSCANHEDALSPAGMDEVTLNQKNPDPGQVLDPIPLNLSFPVIWTYPESAYLLDPYIFKTESITIEYTGSYPGAYDVAWLIENGPWYPQPLAVNENAWVADNLISDAEHHICFVDWGNPMENTAARVGWRFPVEVALYEKIGEMTEAGFVGTTMEAFTMACLEYPASRVELFGTNKDTFASCFATVVTSEFTATVQKKDGGPTSEIRLDPAVGPSGKMNFASASGGWIPTESGWHTITLIINDPNIILIGAEVENDEHYDLLTGEKLQDLSHHKEELSGVYYNTTYIDVYVEEASGRN